MQTMHMKSWCGYINMRQNSKTDQVEHLMRVKGAIHKKS